MTTELTLEQRYCDHLTRIYNRLSLTALPERDPGVKDLPLDKVFVKLTVVVPAPPSSAWGRDEFPRQPHPLRSTDGEKELEEEWRWHQQREAVNKAPPPLPISIATVLQRHRHLVILGAPGSGKTTLLRWLAITFAQQQQAQPDRLGTEFSQERVPILLELRRFVSRAQQWIDSPGVFNLAEEICQWIDKDARFAGITAEWMSQVLTQQPCLLLLDGLDEIADLEARRRLLESLEAFSQNPQYEKVQCILTSRFHGFQGISLGANFQQTEVHPFTEEDIAQFVQYWYATAYAEASECQAEAQQLIDAIQANSRVKELAQNPLLCTIIAIIYRNNRILPHRRIELYWKCCEALLDTWERNKAIKASGLIGGFDWQTKLELLMPVAYWLHEKNHGQLAVPEEEVERLLTQSLEELRERSGLSGGKPIEQEAREFIVVIRDRSGLLQGRGDGTLEFTHRTFQEYLAARYIAKQEETVCIDWVMTHLHQEWWREVHLLVIGHLGSGGDTAEKATRLLLTILHDTYQAPSRWLLPPQRWWWGHWLDVDESWQAKIATLLLKLSLWLNVGTWLPRLRWQRRLAWHILREFELVAQGYADCTPAGRTQTLAKALSDFAVQRVFQWQYHPVYKTQKSFLIKILAKYVLPREEMATLFVKELSNKRKRAWVRRAAAASLGHLGQASEAVVTALVQALQDPEEEVRSMAAGSLGFLGRQASEAVVTALVQALQDPKEWVRRAATESLGRLGQASEVVVTALVQALQDPEERVRSTAAGSLGGLGQASEAVVTALVQALQDQEEVRRAAAKSLGRLGQASEAVVTALIQALQDPKEWVCDAATASLGGLGQASEAVVTALIQALQNPEKRVRTVAAWSLGGLGQASEAVVTALVQALQDPEEVRSVAAWSLGRLGQASEAVVTALVQALQDPEKWVRSAAAVSLGDLGQASEAVVTALVQALQDPKEWVLRYAAAESLGRLGQASEAIVTALVQALQYPEEGVRGAAAESLGGLGQASEAVVTALVQALQDPEDRVRRAAAESLGQLEKIENKELWTKVLIVLQQKLHDSDEDVHRTAFESLRQLLEGKQIPGYRWQSLVKRQQRRELWKRGGFSLVVLLLFIVMLPLGLWWYPNETNLIAIFFTVIVGGIQVGLWLKPFLAWWRGKKEK